MSETIERKEDTGCCGAAPCSAWAAIWRSANKMDGETRHIIHRGLLPAIFKTRKQTVEFIEKEYGYIRHRTDLKREPHGWRIPKPVRVTITPNTKLSGGEKEKP